MQLASAVALTALLAGAAPARAQPAEPEEEKHQSTALALSIGGTLAGVGLFAFGYHSDRPELLAGGALTAIVAPSFGHFYAGEYVTPGGIVRLGGAGLALTGLVIAMTHWSSPNGPPDYAGVLAVGGGILMASGAIADIAGTPRAVARYNRKHAFSISPSVVSSGGGPSGFGLSIGGSF